jgi:hypothetical protein
MWYKLRLLQIPERQRLPELRENQFMHAAATVITETITKHGKTVKNVRNKRHLEYKNTKTNK